MIKKIPITVKTAVINVLMSIDEINRKEGTRPYLMVVEQGTADMTIMGCDSMADVIFYADYFCRFKELIPLENMAMMRVLIADPTDLPFSLPLASDVFVLNDEVGIEKFGYMYEATDYIETTMAAHTCMKIEDFAVLIGIELSDIIKTRVINKIEEKRLEQVENCVAKETNSDT